MKKLNIEQLEGHYKVMYPNHGPGSSLGELIITKEECTYKWGGNLRNPILRGLYKGSYEIDDEHLLFNFNVSYGHGPTKQVIRLEIDDVIEGLKNINEKSLAPFKINVSHNGVSMGELTLNLVKINKNIFK